MLTSGKERVFCSGANIYMLGQASHAEKVNFCKFTNETRNGIEDSSAHSGPQIHRRGQRRLRRRRLRAGARLRRDHHGRRPVEHGQPARSAAARRPARHRRPDAAGRQAQGAARPRRRVLHHRRRGARRSRQGVGAGRPDRAARPVPAARRRARPRARRAQRPPGRCRGCSARRRSNARSTSAAIVTAGSRSTSRRTSASRP